MWVDPNLAHFNGLCNSAITGPFYCGQIALTCDRPIQDVGQKQVTSVFHYPRRLGFVPI